MTLATQNPPNLRAQAIMGGNATSRQHTQSKSIFASKTFWGVVFTTVAAIAPIVGDRIDAGQFKARDAAQIVVILCGAASAVIGRVDAGAVHTPDSLPGPNKSDFF